MTGAVKEICIFVIIAQAVMFFVPGNSYVKYVRVLVGIMMILKITEPIFGLLLDEEKEKEIRERILLLEQNIDLSSEELELEECSTGIYESITDELRERLNSCESGYEVLDAELTDDQMLVITVAEKERADKIQIERVVVGEDSLSQSSLTEEKEEELKKIFGDCISVDTKRITLLFRSRQ